MRCLKLSIFIFLMVCALIGCTQPVGSISTSGGGNVDFWIIEVVEREYSVGDSFILDKNHYYITSFESGTETRVFPTDPNVDTQITDDPDNLIMAKPVTRDPFVFTEAGKHEVLVTYKGRTKTYRITVRGTWDREPGENEKGIGGGIIWD